MSYIIKQFQIEMTQIDDMPVPAIIEFYEAEHVFTDSMDMAKVYQSKSLAENEIRKRNYQNCVVLKLPYTNPSPQALDK